VKIRGYRIEPGEIEARLAEHPAVREAVVMTQPDAAGEKQLVAYWIPTDTSAKQQDIQLWPSIGEYAVYDEFIYHGLSHDDLRNDKYRRALQKIVRGKTVLDVGTGKDAVLARLCAELGARRVYAVDILERSYRSAKQTVARLGLEDRIEVLLGDAHQLQLLEPIDICVSEIVEAIGGAEGAASIINGIRRLMAPDGVMIPGRSVTRIAAVSLPEGLAREPAFTSISAHYVRKIFQQVGGVFDVRLCIKNFPTENILSSTGVFEELDYNRPIAIHSDHDLTLTVTRDGRYDGFLVWLCLYVDEQEVVDILEHPYAWFPVYLPIHDPGLPVREGDLLRLHCRIALSDDGVHPDYFLEGVVEREGHIIDRFEHASVHHDLSHRARPYYDRLFAQDCIAEQTPLPGNTAQQLSQYLAGRLPDYMIPAAFVQLEALPLTANGKLDRQALLAPDEHSYARAAYAPPQGEIETQLAQIWEELLGMPKIGRYDDFFQIGGHSLLAIQMLGQLSKTFRVTLPLSTLLAQPTVAALANIIPAHRTTSEDTATSSIVAIAREQPLPLSFAQQGLWFLDRLGAKGTYHIPMALRLHGDLNQKAWRRALDALLARHESLRTVFPMRDKHVRAELLPADQPMPWTEHDLRQHFDAHERLQQLFAEEARRSFELDREPPIRAQLVRLADQEHVFLLTQHHIASDGWSFEVMGRELSALYRAFNVGQPDPLPPLAIQYPDYAAWQRQYLTGERLHTLQTYWRQTLSGASPLLELPTDRARPAQQSYTGADTSLSLDAALSRQLKQLSKRHGSTLFMIVLSAWAVVLSRLSGRDNLVIGTPMANRGPTDVDGLIGLFANIVPLRIDLSDEPSVAELLARVRSVTLGAHDHQELPFEQVVEIANPPRRLDCTPLFQVIFAWQNQVTTTLDLPALDAQVEPLPCEWVKFDLELDLGERGDTIEGTLRYSTALFDAGTIERLRGYLVAVLQAMACDAEQPVSAIPLLDHAERELLLETFNHTAALYPQQVGVHALFEAQAQRTPDSVAVIHNQCSFSYSDLNVRANRLAHQLIALGVKPGDCLATVLERGSHLVIAQLAILKVGAVYVPIDPQAPLTRQTWVVADCAARRVLLRCTHADPEALGVPAIVMESLPDTGPDTPPDLVLDIDRPAYVMYTSGSTGTPKGVVVSHRGINCLLINNGFLEFTSEDRIAWLGNPAFDIGTLEVWAPLVHGGCIVVIDHDCLLQPAHLRALLLEHDVSIMFLTAGLFRQIADELGEALTQLRVLMVGGDAVDPATVARVLEHYAPQQLLDCYGPTEAVTFATSAVLTLEDARATRLSIGRPIANTRIYLLDAQGQLVPLGSTGEIYVGGDGVALGYLNRPELTTERFLPDPFHDVPGARMYRTGDLARYLPDGRLIFLGRNDQQVKIRGYRIEPGEIEARLAEHPAVREAVVMTQPNAAGEKRLVAYITVHNRTPEPVSALRAHLSACLPDYMLPSAFVLMEKLPLTPQGKLDRRALPVPQNDAFAHRDYAPPQGAMEQCIAEIWSELLGVARVGRNDNFFELGGHSLLAVQLVGRVETELDTLLPLTTLFDYATLTDFAKQTLIASMTQEFDLDEMQSLFGTDGE